MKKKGVSTVAVRSAHTTLVYASGDSMGSNEAAAPPRPAAAVSAPPLASRARRAAAPALAPRLGVATAVWATR